MAAGHFQHGSCLDSPYAKLRSALCAHTAHLRRAADAMVAAKASQHSCAAKWLLQPQRSDRQRESDLRPLLGGNTVPSTGVLALCQCRTRTPPSACGTKSSSCSDLKCGRALTGMQGSAHLHVLVLFLLLLLWLLHGLSKVLVSLSLLRENSADKSSPSSAPWILHSSRQPVESQQMTQQEAHSIAVCQ